MCETSLQYDNDHIVLMNASKQTICTRRVQCQHDWQRKQPANECHFRAGTENQARTSWREFRRLQSRKTPQCHRSCAVRRSNDGKVVYEAMTHYNNDNGISRHHLYTAYVSSVDDLTFSFVCGTEIAKTPAIKTTLQAASNSFPVHVTIDRKQSPIP